MSENTSKIMMSSPDLKKLLKLEELFHNHLLTAELLNELISIYVTMIGMLEKENMTLKTYFLEKMQFILGQAEIIRLLDYGNRSSTSVIEESIQPIQLKLERQRTVGHFPMTPKNNEQKINMQIKVMKEVEENMRNLSHQVNQADLKHENQNAMISNITKYQNDQLEKRLEKRRQRHLKISIEADERDFHSIPPIKKEQLVEAQKELDEAIERFTKSITDKQRQSITLESELPPGKLREIKEESAHRMEQISVQSIQSIEEKQPPRQSLKSSQYW